MSDPITTLLELNQIILNCDATDDLIKVGRAMFPTDQEFQLEMDRQQTTVDKKRKFVELIMLDISRRN